MTDDFEHHPQFPHGHAMGGFKYSKCLQLIKSIRRLHIDTE